MYESGVYLATLLGIIKVSFKGAKALSIEAKNYKKVDLYLDLPSGKFISKEPVNFITFVFRLCWVVVFFPLLSWIAVGYHIYTFLKWRISISNSPDEIKVIKFRFKNTDLTTPEVIDCISSMNMFVGPESASKIPDENKEIKN